MCEEPCGFSPCTLVLLKAGPRDEASERYQGDPWLIAFDANQCPEDFEKSFRFQKEQMYVVATKEAYDFLFAEKLVMKSLKTWLRALRREERMKMTSKPYRALGQSCERT